MIKHTIMNTIIRVSLLFKNPSAVELIQLGNVIWVGKSLEKQEIIIDSPKLISYTNTRVENVNIIRELEKIILGIDKHA